MVLAISIFTIEKAEAYKEGVSQPVCRIEMHTGFGRSPLIALSAFAM